MAHSASRTSLNGREIAAEGFDDHFMDFLPRQPVLIQVFAEAQRRAKAAAEANQQNYMMDLLSGCKEMNTFEDLTLVSSTKAAW